MPQKSFISTPQLDVNDQLHNMRSLVRATFWSARAAKRFLMKHFDIAHWFQQEFEFWLYLPLLVACYYWMSCWNIHWYVWHRYSWRWNFNWWWWWNFRWCSQWRYMRNEKRNTKKNENETQKLMFEYFFHNYFTLISSLKKKFKKNKK